MTLNKLKLMGKKRGMMQFFDEKGQAVACTVIEMKPNVIAQLKTTERDGYQAVQLGSDPIEGVDPRTVVKRIGKPLVGHYKKANVTPCRYLSESVLDSLDGIELGQAIGLETFEGVEYVDVTATSKGKGFQGVIKRHHFAGGPASHGSGFHRHGGSTGMRTSPGRCLPGQKMPGHMGDTTVTVQNLKVISIDLENQVIIVAGAVPGACHSMVYVSSAIKRSNKKKT